MFLQLPVLSRLSGRLLGPGMCLPPITTVGLLIQRVVRPLHPGGPSLAQALEDWEAGKYWGGGGGVGISRGLTPPEELELLGGG